MTRHKNRCSAWPFSTSADELQCGQICDESKSVVAPIPSIAMPSIFTKIIDREIPADIVYEDDLCMAFRDINPKAPVHVLVIPKKEIVSLADLTEDDQSVVGHCVLALSKIAAQEGLDDGYKMLVNCGEAGGQEVPHLHFHLLGGK